MLASGAACNSGAGAAVRLSAAAVGTTISAYAARSRKVLKGMPVDVRVARASDAHSPFSPTPAFMSKHRALSGTAAALYDALGVGGGLTLRISYGDDVTRMHCQRLLAALTETLQGSA